MAITYRDSAADGSSSGTGNRSCAFTPASGDLLLVFCCVAANTNDTPTCDDDNSDAGTYTRISCRPYLSGGNNYRLSCFVRNQSMSNTDATTITVATGSNTSGVVIVVAVTGSHRVGSSAVLQSNGQSSQSAGGTPAPAFSSSALTGNLTLTAVGNATTGASVTAPTNWTERQWISRTSNNVQMSACTRDYGFTGTTITWGGTSATEFASHAIELDGSVPSIAPSVISSTSTTQSPSVGGHVHPDGTATTSTVSTGHEIEHDGIALDGAIGTTSTTQQPSVGGAVALDVIATSSTGPQPTISGFVALDAVATTSTTQSPHLVGYLAPSAVSTTAVAQEPALVGFIETGATATTIAIQTHTLEAVIAASVTSTSSTTQQPSVDGVVTLSAVGTTITTNDPSLGATISLSVVSTTGTVHTPVGLADTPDAITLTSTVAGTATVTATVLGAATLSSPVGATVTTTATVLGAATVTSTVPGTVSI